MFFPWSWFPLFVHDTAFVLVFYALFDPVTPCWGNLKLQIHLTVPLILICVFRYAANVTPLIPGLDLRKRNKFVTNYQERDITQKEA